MDPFFNTRNVLKTLVVFLSISFENSYFSNNMFPKRKLDCLKQLTNEFIVNLHTIDQNFVYTKDPKRFE